MIRTFLSGILLLFICSAFAQSEPAYRSFTTDVGLASNEVYGAFQDSEGYMWFATDMGVSRYDGYEFENFDTQSGLSDNTTLSIFEDRLGKIWFLSISGKLSYYHKGKVSAYKYNDSITSNMRKGTMYVSSYIDRIGSVYLTGNTPGLIVGSQGKTWRPHQRELPASYLPDSKTWVYVKPGENDSFKRSSFYFERSGIKLATIPFEPKQPTGASTYRTTEDKNFIYTTFADVCLKVGRDGKNAQIFRSPRAILFIYRDHDNGLWLVISQSGLLYFPNSDLTKKPQHYLKNHAVSSIYQDRNGSFWLTTEKGVLQVPSINYQKPSNANGLYSDNTTCLTGYDGSVYAGTYDGGLNKISPDGTMSTVITPFKDYKVSLYKLYSQGDTLWYTGRGIAGYSYKGVLKRLPELDFSRDIEPSPNGLYSGNFGKLFRIGDRKISNIKSPDRISSLLWHNQAVLAGTISGLWIYRLTDSTWQHLNYIHPDLNNSITDIVKCGNQILLSTKGFGVFILNTQLSDPRLLNVQNGLSSNNIKEIYPDGNYVWLATDKGLNRVTLPIDVKYPDVLIRTTEHGLASNRINAVIRHIGKLWVATDKGITIVTDIEKDQTRNIPFYLSYAEINGKQTSIVDLANLSASENNITIHYKSIPVHGAENIRYQYRIKGYDNKWNYTTQKQVQFVNLSPGNYEFQVGIAGSDPIEMHTVQICISAPIWTRWWFIASLSVLITLVIALIVRRRALVASRIERQRELINQQITQLELKALRSQMNPHFLFNCMNSIQRFILNNDKHEAYTYMVKFSRLMRLVLESADQDFVSLKSELEALQLYLELEKLRFKSRFRFEIVERISNTEQLQIPAMLIQPYVENALWHGLMLKEEYPFLTVEIRVEEEILIIMVEDNGVGREFAMRTMREESHKSHGMKITHERLLAFSNKYKLNFDVKVIDLYADSAAAGTRILIRLPLKACTLQTPQLYATKNPDHR